MDSRGPLTVLKPKFTVVSAESEGLASVRVSNR